MADNNQERQDIYAHTRQDLLARSLSNSEKYDGAILALSMGALGVSTTYIKNIVPIEEALHISYLVTSWMFFGFAIIITVISFQISQQGIKTQLKYAEKYYLDEEKEYGKKKNRWAIWTTFLNIASGLFFVFAIILTIYFVSINIIENHEKETFMTEKKIIQKGADIQKMQKALVTNGAEIPAMQMVEPDNGTTLGQTIPDMQPVTPDVPQAKCTQDNSETSKQSDK